MENKDDEIWSLALSFTARIIDIHVYIYASMHWSELFKHFIEDEFMTVQGEYYDPFISGEEDKWSLK